MMTQSAPIEEIVSDLLAATSPAAEPSKSLAPPAASNIAFVPNAMAPGFVSHAYEKAFEVAAPVDRVWWWLERPETFTESQVWPYRVEFVSPEPGVAPGFVVGGLNIHHGPFLHLPGMLTEIHEGQYRDLQYLYGSYVGSPRLIRPTRLEFWVEDLEPERTRVRLRLSSYVRRGLARPWTWSQKVFWSRFPRWMRSELVGSGKVSEA